jgi:acetyl-CoA carboxylase biotin carboxyl carrier protein
MAAMTEELASGMAAGTGNGLSPEPTAVGPGRDPSPARPPDVTAAPAEAAEPAAADHAADVDAAEPLPVDGDDAALLGLIDRLAAVLERGDLAELEVTAGGTTLILRSALAVERPAAVAVAAAEASSSAGAAGASGGPGAGPADPDGVRPAAERPAVRAPLTGIYYSSPSPGATPYVALGDQVSVGQIIGLIEAMKLFNEIKSDLAGRVVRICADNGALVKAKQPLIEVEPQ